MVKILDKKIINRIKELEFETLIEKVEYRDYILQYIEEEVNELLKIETV